MAPKKPPIYEKTDDIFWTSRLITKEAEDLNITILTYKACVPIVRGRLITEPSRMEPYLVYSLVKGQKLLSELIV